MTLGEYLHRRGDRLLVKMKQSGGEYAAERVAGVAEEIAESARRRGTRRCLLGGLGVGDKRFEEEDDVDTAAGVAAGAAGAVDCISRPWKWTMTRKWSCRCIEGRGNDASGTVLNDEEDDEHDDEQGRMREERAGRGRRRCCCWRRRDRTGYFIFNYSKIILLGIR